MTLEKSSELPLSTTEKIWASVLMILAIIIPLLVIIILWPNKMPTVENTIYYYDPFQVTLIDSAKQGTDHFTTAVQAAKDRLKEDETKSTKLTKAKADAESKAESDKATGKLVDCSVAKKAAKDKDSDDSVVIADKAAVKKAEADKKNTSVQTDVQPSCGTIQFGALILILVAASGFLGNMVHVASSFTAFIGADKFKRSWIMWYAVKPFTASGLAVFLYLALNSSTITTPVNLNGILATAALAGLFTDIATQKLKEIFTVAFKPSDNRPDKLPAGKQTINLANIQPEKIDVNQVNNFLIPGQDLDSNNIVISINGKKIDPATITITPTMIKFTYTVADADKTLTKFTLLITDAKGVKVDGKDIGV
jgi:hypothetical protein